MIAETIDIYPHLWHARLDALSQHNVLLLLGEAQIVFESYRLLRLVLTRFRILWLTERDRRGWLPWRGHFRFIHCLRQRLSHQSRDVQSHLQFKSSVSSVTPKFSGYSSSLEKPWALLILCTRSEWLRRQCDWDCRRRAHCRAPAWGDMLLCQEWGSCCHFQQETTRVCHIC